MICLLAKTSFALVDWCELPYSTGGGQCGPEFLEGIGLFQFTKFRVNYKYFKFPSIRTQSDEFNFDAACSAHDQCYLSRFQAKDRTTCRAIVDKCNQEFYDNLDYECNRGRWSCQRSYCKDILRDGMHAIVDLSASKYKDDCEDL